MRSYLLLSASIPCLAFAGCTNGSEELSGVEGMDYRGCQDKTRSGRTCQAWVSQTPQSHENGVSACGEKCATVQAVLTGMGDDNYCRNPDGELTIWCYTTDANKRWEYCNPIGAAMVTECEATTCSETFADMNSTGKREQCYAVAKPNRWPSLASCCPAIGQAAMCALRNCTLAGDLTEKGQPKSESLKLGAGDLYDAGVGFHLVLSALLCACLKDCSEGADVVYQVLKQVNSIEDAMKLVVEINKQGLNHSLMPSICAPNGWRCRQNSASCTELVNNPEFGASNAAVVDGIAATHCSPLDVPTETQTSSTTTSQPNGDVFAVSFAHTSLSAGGMILASISAWLS